jgi:hypothetical protein
LRREICEEYLDLREMRQQDSGENYIMWSFIICSLHWLFSSLVIVIRNIEVVIRARTYHHRWRYENGGIQERIFVHWRANKFGLQTEKDTSRRSCSMWRKQELIKLFTGKSFGRMGC